MYEWPGKMLCLLQKASEFRGWCGVGGGNSDKVCWNWSGNGFLNQFFPADGYVNINLDLKRSELVIDEKNWWLLDEGKEKEQKLWN